jgi:pimeloyl-ACP methyl ester carboxylesterase
VLAPDQRGYGRTDKPKPVEAYDIVQLTSDLVGLLDHYGYEKALFVGHDWGALVVWAMAVMHPDRVSGVINLSVSFLDRGTTEWVEIWEKLRGDDFYIVHFNRKPGGRCGVRERSKNLLRNLYRTGQWEDPRPVPPQRPGMAMINRRRPEPARTPDDVGGGTRRLREGIYGGGFTGPINWYRNFTRNWKRSAPTSRR